MGSGVAANIHQVAVAVFICDRSIGKRDHTIRICNVNIAARGLEWKRLTK